MVPRNSHELTVCFSHSSMLNIHHFLQLSLRLVVIFCTRLADAFDGKNATGYVNYAVFGHIGDHCHAAVLGPGTGEVFFSDLVLVGSDIGGHHGTFSGWTSGTSPQGRKHEGISGGLSCKKAQHLGVTHQEWRDHRQFYWTSRDLPNVPWTATFA